MPYPIQTEYQAHRGEVTRVIPQAEVVAALEDIAPATLAEHWDKVGWQLRSSREEVSGILCAVDATAAVVDEAVQQGANLVLAHHPLIFRPLFTLDISTRIGNVLARALQHGISIIAAHTNWDSAPGGVSWALARALDLEPDSVLEPNSLTSGAGLGVMTRAARALSTAELVDRIHQRLGHPVMAQVGERSAHMRIALMGGSGSSAIRTAAQREASLYVTADVRYHDAQEAEALGLDLLVIDHGASERPGMAELCRLLSQRLRVPLSMSQISTSPWR